MNLAADLVGAVGRGEISAVFQPQIDVNSGRIVAVEALARWRHPTAGPIEPAIFIPLAEKSELISEIGAFMIDEGCRCAAVWLDADVDVSINVSAAQLETLDLLDLLQEKLAQHGLDADTVTIEITESLPIADVPAVHDRLVALRDLGLGISVDDFGTGHSSVVQLLSLPATEVKLDQSLVREAAVSSDYMRTVVELAHDQGLRVVAEGVETEEHFAMVRDLNCDRAQGYFFGRPLPEHETTALLAAR